MNGKTTGEEKKKEFLALLDNVADIPGVEDCTRSKMYQRQWLTCSNFILGLFLFGMAQGHSTVLMDQLSQSKSTQEIFVEDPEARSWIVSIMVLCMCPSCWILAAFNRVLGRRSILSISMGIFFSGWLTIALANNATHLLVGRALIGLSAGIFIGLAAVYQGECSIPQLRTTLNSTHAVSFTVGVEVCHAMSVWLHWRTIALSAGLVALLALASILRMPESPIWLIGSQRYREAIRSWTFLRGIQDLEELKAAGDVVSNRDNSNTGTFDKYHTPTFWKPLGIMLVFFTVVQVSGMGAVMNYCTVMIRSIATEDRVNLGTLLLDTSRVISAISLSLVTKKYSSRTLSLYSGFVTASLLILLSTTIITQIWAPWSSLVLLFGYQAAVMGLVALPWAFCSELFSSTHKAVAMGIVTSYNYLLFFVVLQVNPNLIVLLEPWGAFLVYGLLTLLGTLVLYFVLPDTRNKSLRDIELMFCKTSDYRKLKGGLTHRFLASERIGRL